MSYSHLERLDRLSIHLRDEAYEERETFVKLLKDITSVVRDAGSANAAHLPQVVEKASDLLDQAVYRAYSREDAFDFLPSYADSEESPLLKDSQAVIVPGFGELSIPDLTSLDRFAHFLASTAGAVDTVVQAIDAQRPQPWPDTPHPHSKSSRLSRFREGITTSITDAAPLARTIYEARCEVAADTIACPVSAAIAADASALALLGAGGWKNRDPILTIYLLDEEAPRTAKGDGGVRICTSAGFRYMALEPGLHQVAHQVAMDTTNKLVLVADTSRIKSFSWGGDVAFGGWTPPRGENVHTMDSRRYNGPIAVLPGGRVVRAGKGGAAVWNLDALQTHRGGKRVGRGKFNVEDAVRDNDDGEIERSTGNAPSTTIKFAQAGLTPAVWHLHAPSGHMLCAENSRKSEKYACYTLDLEAGAGKIVSRFLGHGGNVAAFSTSAGDANVFLTACADGYARLYDVREPLPVMTIDAGKSGEFCDAATLVHPDGIPIIFTGGSSSQSIMTWDIRARALVYELSTGNTAVHTLTWDDRRATLYAGTECDYMDRNGSNYDYRSARIPRWAEQCPEDRMAEDAAYAGDEADEMDEDDEEYDSADESDDEHYWPKRVAHDEKTFGYAYDAGEHVFLRYKFKEDADPTVLPAYGQAREDSGYW
ncbi:hypothetical protein C2E23DRAFT_34630 [Lenzites betulinus]|nr:hypothetical protein C2E23DRAFT_34630 [Lenzites betulinus]